VKLGRWEEYLAMRQGILKLNATYRSRLSNDLGGCLSVLPGFTTETQGAESVRLIDVLWLDRESHRVVAAFEVEHSTTIYSGIVRMLDLARGSEAQALEGLLLVAPDKREADVREQLWRPAFSRIADLKVRYLPYGRLRRIVRPLSALGRV
jgi:type II restriction enzyme